ncbi:MAG: hypothetical protein Q8Q00_12365 [Dehalococcoidia bacterium]|nr:hypothetical protein [Dehalococcoidia bacterium]
MRTVAFAGLLTCCAALIACGRSAGEDVSALLQSSAEAMASQSFSFTVTDCALCPPPIVTEYAAPDGIKLSHSKGHDDWPYYLIAGDRWMFSSEGKR